MINSLLKKYNQQLTFINSDYGLGLGLQEHGAKISKHGASNHSPIMTKKLFKINVRPLFTPSGM